MAGSPFATTIGMDDQVFIKQQEGRFVPKAYQFPSLEGQLNHEHVTLSSSPSGFESYVNNSLGSSIETRYMNSLACHDNQDWEAALISDGQHSSDQVQTNSQYKLDQQQKHHLMNHPSLPKLNGIHKADAKASRFSGHAGQKSSIIDTYPFPFSYVKEHPSYELNPIFESNCVYRNMEMSRQANASVKGLSPPQDHIMAERRRRERLSECFIALTALIPGMKKADKVSVLGDTIKYVKYMQEKIRALEERLARTSDTISTKKLSSHQKDSLNGKTFFSKCIPKPEVEVQKVENDILIRVHCKKEKSLLVKAMAELEKLHMAIKNASIVSFSDTMLDLTFCAQVDQGVELKADDIAELLQVFFEKIN